MLYTLCTDIFPAILLVWVYFSSGLHSYAFSELLQGETALCVGQDIELPLSLLIWCLPVDDIPVDYNQTQLASVLFRDGQNHIDTSDHWAI
ncbi:hypothetical protein K439DRAFT_1642807 [Ramaria rubella]|nr:hypothetical protein K439DRAFT_1643463 [Ramaria rubella]KAF8573650.1 hypothetical protein K439DRAFT_1642807 [Ramaria rubella]